MNAVAPPPVDVPQVDSKSAAAADRSVERFDRSLPRDIVPSGGVAPAPPDDSWRLMALFAVFVVAPLVVVAAVWAVAAIGTLLALVLALGVYLVVTTFVCATVAFLLSGPLPPAAPHHHAG